MELTMVKLLPLSNHRAVFSRDIGASQPLRSTDATQTYRRHAAIAVCHIGREDGNQHRGTGDRIQGCPVCVSEGAAAFAIHLGWSVAAGDPAATAPHSLPPVAHCLPRASRSCCPSTSPRRPSATSAGSSEWPLQPRSTLHGRLVLTFNSNSQQVIPLLVELLRPVLHCWP